jgi:predicted SAM-dependent methyltransferase
LDRQQEILRHIGAGTRGIEVAPWYKPIVPRGGEREVVVLDVFDRPTLLTRAENDPNIDAAMIPQIDEVDLVGSACEIAELARERFGAEARFDFVVSSHNLEHLPDPVRFLRGCEALLTPGGMVSMVVPDKRACFDFFRPHSTTGEMLQAFHERRARPSFAQIFNQGAYNATLSTSGGVTGAFTIDDDPNQIALRGDVVKQYADWLQRRDANDDQYYDTHCWTFTPASLELILTELALIGLINFDIVSVTKPYGCEFIVHLRKRAPDASAPSGLAGRRELLLKQTADELAHASPYARRLRVEAMAPRRKLFMVHIPKTAGDTINHLLTEMLGEEQVRLHVESIPDFLINLQSLPGKVRYVSGHHRLPEVLPSIDRTKWFVFASLRNPVLHLISHLKWVKALGAPAASAFRRQHRASIQEMAGRLWEIELNDIEGIHRFINEEFDEAKQFFDNCQVRYLIDYHDHLIGHADAIEAVEALGRFDYVGLTEALSDTLARITHAVGISGDFDAIPNKNQSPLDEVVDLDDPAIRDFYCDAVKWDAHVYTAAKQMQIFKGTSAEQPPSA